MTNNRTPTPVYLDPGMHPGLEVKGLNGRHYSASQTPKTNGNEMEMEMSGLDVRT